jgi:tetratricopeptide (TPR) repeat protein
MDQDQGITLLQQKLGKGADSTEYTLEELSQLAMAVDSMPLAMAQAAAYIRESRPQCSVRQYLDRLAREQTRLDVLGQHTRDLRRDRNAQNSILKTWHITFEHIHQQESSAADLLSLMSFFDRNAIPEALLHTRVFEHIFTSKPDSPARSSVRHSFREFMSRHHMMRSRSGKNHVKQQSDPLPDPEGHARVNDKLVVSAGIESLPATMSTSNLDHDIQMLRNYSLVTVVADSPSFGMHSLVQLATQDWLKANDSFERWGSQFMTNLDEAFPKGFFKDREICRPLFPHVFAAMEVKLHDRNSILRRAMILTNGARHAHVNGAYTDSYRMSEEALRSRSKLLGPEHKDTVWSMQALGLACANLGQWAKAESVLAEALDRAKRVWGENHEDTLQAMGDLAVTYSSNGKLVDAEKMQTRFLHKMRENYGENHPGTLAATRYLAITVSKRGRHNEAEALASRALRIAMELYPARHPKVLSVLHAQAMTYHESGKYEEARRLFSEILPPSSELLGNDHPDTLATMHCLARTLYRLGRRKSALDLLRDCAEKSERKLGPHHTATVERYKQLRDGLTQFVVE